MAQYRNQRALFGTHMVLTRHNENYTIALCDADGSNERHPNKVAPSDYCPRAPPGTLEIESKDLAQVFVKYPHLKVWHPEVKDIYLQAIQEETMREVNFCEVLRFSPHPNVAEYRGCIVKDGLIRGICFTRYEKTLNQAVNPEHKKKNDFRYGKYPLPRGRDLFMSTLRAGLKHIHNTLGYICCDCKPDNIMLKSNGEAVIIDFNSCLPIGAPMRVARTPGWCDPEAYHATKGVDDDAVSDIGEWLSKRRTKHYHFVDEDACAAWWPSSSQGDKALCDQMPCHFQIGRAR